MKLTKVGRETLAHVARETLAGQWARARRHGERPSLASLHTRGYLIRRPWRGEEGHPDAAYEYRLAPALEKILREPKTVNGSGARAYSTFAPSDQADADLAQAALEGR